MVKTCNSLVNPGNREKLWRSGKITRVIASPQGPVFHHNIPLMSTFTSSPGHRIVFLGKGQVGCEEFQVKAPGAGQVVVKTLCSLMSTGTENIVLNQNYAKGTHWDQWVQSFPFYPGYSIIGKVGETSDGANGLKKGQTVALRCTHSSYHVEPVEQCIPVPQDVDPRQAVWFALAKIAFMGVHAGKCSLGSRVMVIGAGPIGQMALRWAAAAGAAELIVVDPAVNRLELARNGGATETKAEPIEELAGWYQKNPSARPEIVIDTTGNAKVFAAALACTADFGRVVVLGDTGFPSQQSLTPDVIGRGLNIVGAHDGHNTATVNNRTICALFFSLIRRGRFNLEGLNTHEFAPAQAAEAYTLANTRRTETMGIVFNWSL